MTRATPALSSNLPLLAPLLLCLLVHRLASAALTGSYQAQSNGVICSPDFGAPLLDDCNRALVEFTTRRVDHESPWFASTVDQAMKEDCVRFPQDIAEGTCVIDFHISIGARNNVAWSTLINIAQTIITTCASPTISQGGYGIYADIVIIISNSSNPVRSSLDINTTTTEYTVPVPAPNDSASTSSTAAKELAAFGGSMWAGSYIIIDASYLPGFSVTEPWQYPTSVYQVYNETESAHCPNDVLTNQDPKCVCCLSSACAKRVIKDTDTVEVKCVWLGYMQSTTEYGNLAGAETLTMNFRPWRRARRGRRRSQRRTIQEHSSGDAGVE